MGRKSHLQWELRNIQYLAQCRPHCQPELERTESTYDTASVCNQNPIMMTWDSGSLDLASEPLGYESMNIYSEVWCAFLPQRYRPASCECAVEYHHIECHLLFASQHRGLSRTLSLDACYLSVIDSTPASLELRTPFHLPVRLWALRGIYCRISALATFDYLYTFTNKARGVAISACVYPACVKDRTAMLLLQSVLTGMVGNMMKASIGRSFRHESLARLHGPPSRPASRERTQAPVARELRGHMEGSLFAIGKRRGAKDSWPVFKSAGASSRR
ncbi:hypothetical protein CC2G_005200 [Coprinopsis cinerea AmutBmut pab1-1]|nr:hypothetical protein CC2G_005200 [Coprinopsis cinerea AmutBmut pab1-1]